MGLSRTTGLVDDAVAVLPALVAWPDRTRAPRPSGRSRRLREVPRLPPAPTSVEGRDQQEPLSFHGFHSSLPPGGKPWIHHRASYARPWYRTWSPSS